MKKENLIKIFVIATIFVVFNVLVFIVQWQWVGWTLKSCWLYFGLTVVVDVSVLRLYLFRCDKYREYYLKEYHNNISVMIMAIISDSIYKFSRTKKNENFLMFKLFNSMFTSKIISYVIGHKLPLSMDLFKVVKKREIIALLSDTRAMIEVYFSACIFKLLVLVSMGEKTWSEFMNSIVIAIIVFIFGSRIFGVTVDKLKNYLISRFVKWYYILSSLYWDGIFFYSKKSRLYIIAIHNMKNDICSRACQVLFSLWSSGIKSDHAI